MEELKDRYRRFNLLITEVVSYPHKEGSILLLFEFPIHTDSTEKLDWCGITGHQLMRTQ